MRIRATVVAAIEAHARDAGPHECCGLLVGNANAITEAVRAANRAADPERRYEIDPHDHFGAIRHARAQGLEVVGAYHSHPRSEPIPSDSDHAEAFENFLFVIAGHEEGRSPVIRAWRFRSGNFVELALVFDP